MFISNDDCLVTNQPAQITKQVYLQPSNESSPFRIQIQLSFCQYPKCIKQIATESPTTCKSLNLDELM